MKKWLTSFFLFFSLATGVLAGTPALTGSAKNDMSAMDCCRKKGMDAKTVSAAQICCAVNCTNPAPTTPGAAFNFSPSSVIISDSILKQIALLFAQEKPVQTIFYSFERKTLPQIFQPKYIQNHSFLI
ncbi:MAG: hypothetical protein M3T96_08010 [Acidobacteriota bacterium]|nr:hypothetical protein [Acidobacteriota bacterium]